MKVKIALDEAKPTDEQFKEMLQYFMDLQKPYVFDPRDEVNILRKLDTDFEETVNVMEDQSHYEPKNLTEYSYYHKMRFLHKKFKSSENASEQS